MTDAGRSQDLTQWVDLLRSRFIADAPELLSLFETYAEEAHFGRSFIAQDLVCLPEGAVVLEVGAGAMILSCQLVREGFRVCALEPTGDGFSHFDKMRDIILQVASETGCTPEIARVPAEMLDAQERFDYAFSVNVMEHVDDVAAVISKVTASLHKGGSYRFFCPNYAFPYEPHFNIPTLFSKRLTERVMKKRIFGHANIPDPAGTWASLNWITVAQVRRLVDASQNLRIEIKRDVMKKMFERVLTDEQFSNRRSAAIRRVITLMVKLRLHYLLLAIPACVQPAIDCRIIKMG